MNDPVKVAIEEWLTQYRPNLMAAYVNYQYLRHEMFPEYEKAGLPEALLFGMLAKESGGKVHAVSRSGASGPLQFMYATGLRFGLTTADGFDQRFDPQLSARANAAYIKEQLAIFNNNLELVIGAYNGGEGAMQRRAGRGEAALSFWSPQVYYGVSQETREYVPMVLAAAWLFMHPERYNLEWPKLATKPGSITLKQPASIAELTVCLGQDGGAADGWFRALRNLNPQLDPQRPEPAGAKLAVPLQLEKVYARDCAAGRWRQLASELHAATIPAPPPGMPTQSAVAKTPSKERVYVVKKGDSLAAIARKNGGCTVREIAEKNALRARTIRSSRDRRCVCPRARGRVSHQSPKNFPERFLTSRQRWPEGLPPRTAGSKNENARARRAFCLRIGRDGSRRLDIFLHPLPKLVAGTLSLSERIARMTCLCRSCCSA
jgi:membrane-bound lytic murein transglycosylase D